MSSTINDVLAGSAVPPWLPRGAQDARQFAYWAQWVFFGSAFIWFVWGIANLAWGWGFLSSGIFYIILAFICGIAGIFSKKSVVDEIDHGRFHEAKNNSIIWIIVGLIAFGVGALMMILVYVKLTDALAPQTPGYSPYAPGTVVAQQYQPPQYQQQAQAPAQQPAAPAQTYYQPPPAQPAGQEHRYQMMKCKNCGVQFPAFMNNCPNCGTPK